MKPILFLLVILVLPGIVLSQSAELKQLEQKVRSLSGQEKAEMKLQLAKQYQKEGFSVKALQIAQQVQSESTGNDRLQGMALYAEAKILVTFEDNREVHLKEAADKLARSYLLLRPQRMPNVKQDELILLRSIQQEIDYIPEEMMKIFSREEETKQKGILSLLGSKKPRKEALKLMTESMLKQEKLAEKLDSLDTRSAEVQEILFEQLDSIDSEKNELQEELLKRQEEIRKMTQAQMQTELILLKTQSLLDSATIQSIQDSLALQRQAFQLQEAELSLVQQENQRNLLFGISGLVFLAAIGLYTRYRNARRYNRTLTEKNRIIQEEQEKSESLLLNILPSAIADELKQKGKATARRYDQATVLFTDFKNFTRISEKLTPEELVMELDYCFSNFDQIIEKHGLEKIKTIGDAYMCAGGLPKPDGSHVVNVVEAALEIQRFLRDWKLEKIESNEPYFEARIGIHSGPLVAGVVGKNKFAYDVWGDTVNIASRIESSGEIGEVNISGATYNLIKQDFNCEYRGKIPIKNKEPIDMYFVRSMAS